MADIVDPSRLAERTGLPSFTRLGDGEAVRLLVESSKLFARSLDASTIHQILKHIVCSTIPCDGILVSSYNRSSAMIQCEFAFVDGKVMDASVFPPLPFNPTPGDGMQSEVIRTGEAKLFSDVSRRVEQGKGKFYQVVNGNEGVEPLPKGSRPKCQSAIMAPLKIDDEVIGVVQVMADQEGAYAGEHLVFVEGLALQMAAAMRNAELFAQMQEEIAERIKTEQELREREEEVQQLNSELEDRVSLRTAQLEQAIAEMEAFCYSVSHDLRQPLRGICGAAMMLLRDHERELSKEAGDHLESLANAAHRMSKLIDDLLQFSRLSRRIMQPTSVNLSDIAERVARAAARKGHSRATVSIEPDLETHADTEMIGIVIDNLLSNAFKFSASKENPRVELGAELHEGRRVFFVRDNGVGFDPTYTHKLFQPFERLHREEDFPGTGIGLANAKRILLRHGGEIWAESTPGEGATFFFTLPERLSRRTPGLQS